MAWSRHGLRDRPYSSGSDGGESAPVCTRRPRHRYRFSRRAGSPIPLAGDPRAALHRDRRRPDDPVRRGCDHPAGRRPDDSDGGAPAAEGSRRLRDQRRAAAGQEGRHEPARVRRAGAASRLGRPTASPASRSPARASSTSRVAAGAQGVVAGADRRRRRVVRRHRRVRGREDQPRVRLRQPDRPDPHRRRPLGGGRRRARPDLRRWPAPRSPASTTSTTTAPRSTGSAGRCWPAPRASRRRRTATAASTSTRSPPPSWRSTPEVTDLPDDEAQEVFRAEGVELMFAEIKQSLHDFGVDFDVYFHENNLHESGAVERAIARLTEMGNTYEKDGALWLRHREVRRRQGPGDHQVRRPGRLHLRRPRLLPRQARARLRPLLHHARRRPPRLRRPDDGDVRRVRRRAGQEPRDPDRPDGQPGQRRRSRCGCPSGPAPSSRSTTWSRRSASTRAATRWPATAPTPPSTSTSTCGPRQSNDNPVFYVQYAHARVLRDPAQRRRARHRRGRPSDFDPSLLAHEKEGELLRALAEFPRVVVSAAELREPHRVARYLEDTAGGLPPVLRQLPGAPDGRRGGQRPAPRAAAAGRRDPHRARQRPALLGVSAPERM